MTKNVGKVFEAQWKKSVPENMMFFRIPDPPQSFQQTARFSLKPPFDSFMFYKNTLFCLELKTTKSKSFSVEMSENDKGMIHYHQLCNLRDYSKFDGIVAGLVLNFRIEEKETELTYFIRIDDFDKMMSKTSKKSFNAIDLLQNGAVKIESTKKRTLFCYGVKEFIENFVNGLYKE
jgi:penicillin-binding protein-related factor A (putative recombinase)